MSHELCTAKTQFSCLTMSDLVMFISFILSHPLYFSYFIFFSPYLIKLIYFLSPLFITTVLLSVAFFTSTELQVQSPASHFVVLCSAFLDRLGWSKKDYEGEYHCHQTYVEILLYEIFFGSNVIELEDNLVPVHEEASQDENVCEDSSDGDGKVEEKTVLDPNLENASRSSNFLKILDGFERMSCDVEDKKKVKPTQSVKTDKVVGKGKQQKEGTLVTDGSEAKANDKPVSIQKTYHVEESETSASKLDTSRITNAAASRQTSLDQNNVGFCSPNTDSSRRMDFSNLGTYGSMRKEKEWKRTLACKLFEERHNVDGGEGMDSLWEAYEVNSDKQKPKYEKSTKAKNKKEMEKTKKTKKNKSEIEYDDDEEETSGGGQLCCLQAALKLSTGKMNLGMGRPNLVKISKAIKGFGWLHHATKHSKKVHNI